MSCFTQTISSPASITCLPLRLSQVISFSGGAHCTPQQQQGEHHLFWATGWLVEHFKLRVLERGAISTDPLACARGVVVNHIRVKISHAAARPSGLCASMVSPCAMAVWVPGTTFAESSTAPSPTHTCNVLNTRPHKHGNHRIVHGCADRKLMPSRALLVDGKKQR